MNRHSRRSDRRPGLPLLAAAMLLAGLTLAAGCETQSMIREKGETAYYAGDYEQAQHHYRRAIDRWPTDHRAHYQLAQSYMQTDQPGRAQRHFEQALSLRRTDPDWAPMLLDHIAEAIHQQDRPERLQAFLEQTVQDYGTTRDRLRQAEYLVKIGDLDGARLAYRKAAYFADADNPEPYVAIADFYEMLDDAPSAVRALRWAHYVNPQDTDIAERLRRYGVTPGPTAAEAPPKSELLR
ncbi:MAG: tetratricopeptide repeat protein [Phycisphaeraceae bacterium]